MGRSDVVKTLTLIDDEIDFAAYMELTDNDHKIKKAKSWRDDLVEETKGIAVWNKGSKLPWAKHEKLLQFRPGEVTLWFGFNGGGKSLINGNAILSQAAQGEVCLICSFEMKPRKTLARMLRQWVGRRLDQITEAEVDAFLDWCEGKIYVYDQTGTADWRKVTAVLKWAADKKKVTVATVDNLMKCVKHDEDYEGQKTFTDTLTAVARDKNIHVHLIHHPRKQEDESRPPRKMDSRGAGAVIDLVDNILIVWKNKPKLEARERGDISKDKEPDALLICDKQRHGEWEGRIQLNFHWNSQQYIEYGTNPCLDFATPFPHKQKLVHGYHL
jgi:twinkle protein